MPLNQHYHDNRVQNFGRPEHGRGQPSTQNDSLQQSFGRDIPRYEPIVSRLNPPQVFEHSHSEGCAGSTFSVRVSDISHDPRTYKFVFGQRKIGAFLERSHTGGLSSVLIAQVPHFSETSWWNDKVPVYLVVTDSQTDAIVHTVQVCEFTYVRSPTPSPLKRYREESRNNNNLLGDGSPVKRPNSQPMQQSATPSYHTMPSSLGTSAFTGHSRQLSQHIQRDMPIPVPYQAPTSLNFGVMRHSSSSTMGREYPDSHYLPTPLSLADTNQTRYIAEPQDHYAGQSRSQDDYGDGPASASRLHHRSPASSSTYYQSSVASSPATWKSPYHSATGLTYTSPSSMKPESTYDNFVPSEDNFDSSAPVLQRTSTLSSAPSSAGGARNLTPTSTQAGWLSSSKAKLEILGDLDDMSRNWSAEEFGCRRRLVQFWRKQEGNVLKVNFRPVIPGTARPLSAVVISCIYWEERQECFFTSVDAIFLLESLVGNKFAVEEKNRIRRNLEGFRPATVSKGKSDCENFFKLIMGFPAPKPRNIEKDVKAFPWRILTAALRKIIGKYSASYEGLKERTAGDTGADDRASSPGPSSVEMPPPTLVRNSTNESASTDVQRQLGSITETSSSQAHSQPRAALESSSSKPRAVSPPRPLSIQVPHLTDNLPVLDNGVSSNTPFERRMSGFNGFPLTGLSNVDFSEFFQSPSAQPGTGSGWPSINTLFPPPSAGFGPDSQPPRKD